MGLLTNANTSQGGVGSLMAKLVSKAALVSWLTFTLGVGYLFLMPHTEFSHKTYFSENALLPGLVRSEFNEEAAAKSYLEDLRDEAQKAPNSVPFPWIEARLKQMGLEVYTHNFTLNFPLGKPGQSYTGVNIYAILRAPRASSTEAIVLSTPYRPPMSIESPTDVSLSLVLASAKFFRRQKYWAKDVIFLITQHEQLGMQAWLEAYHRTSCGHGKNVLDHGDLEARAGSIQAAINLEISTEKVTHLNVKVEGLNGQLPNLDLFNLINRLCMREGMHQMFQGVEDHPRPDSWNGYWRSFNTFVSMALKQAAGGVPSGNHGLFHRFGIEAVTIEGVRRPSKGRRREFDLYTMGRIVEGTFRSLNNLLERFHQSFFFYLLPSTNRYVSIGMYMPGIGLLASGFLISALGLWSQYLTSLSSTTDNDEDFTPKMPCPNLIPVLKEWVVCHALGGLLTLLPTYASRLGTGRFDLNTDEAVVLGILAYCLMSAFFVMRRAKRRTGATDWKLVKCVALLELAVISFSMSLCNFSLAYLVTSVYVPVALLSQPSKSRLAAVMKGLAVWLAHPLSIVFFACFVDTARTFPEKGVSDLISSGLSATKTAITFSIADSYIYGNYTYAIATLSMMPCWYMLWFLVNCSEPQVKTGQPSSKKNN